jgi:hypothetical protein
MRAECMVDQSMTERARVQHPAPLLWLAHPAWLMQSVADAPRSAPSHSVCAGCPGDDDTGHGQGHFLLTVT